MSPFRKFLIYFASFTSLILVLLATRQALHSSLFVVQSVEIESQSKYQIYDTASLIQWTTIKIGETGLFEVNFREVELKLLEHEWIQDVRLKKKFPNTLVVVIEYRRPIALFQNAKGALSYVDAEGARFGTLDLSYPFDLPILTGFSSSTPSDGEAPPLSDVLSLLNAWNLSKLRQWVSLSTVSWSPDKGYQLLISSISPEIPLRTKIFMGRQLDEMHSQLSSLVHVLNYLRINAIAAQQIWADVGKKVVVKTIPRS